MEELIIKYLAGEASSEEAQEVLAWISLSADNESFYLAYKKILDAGASTLTKEIPRVDIDHEWQHFLKTVQKNEVKVVPFESTRPVWMKVAAALIILLLSGFIATWLVSRNKDIIYKTQNESLALVLPDGTHIMLNDHSSLAYSPGFGDKSRVVKLSGEAFFDVAHDKQKPFVINLDHAAVEVVGTSFDVRSYGTEKAIEVTVATGIVKFSAPADKQEIRLTAGQKGIFVKDSKTLNNSVNTDPNFSSWNTRRIVFIDSDLKSVIETLAKTYHTTLTLEMNAPPSCSVTVTFDHQNLDAVLRVLEKTLNLTIERKDNKIKIVHAGC